MPNHRANGQTRSSLHSRRGHLIESGKRIAETGEGKEKVACRAAHVGSIVDILERRGILGPGEGDAKRA